MTVSTLILTLNEEANIAACLDSLAWCDDIVVLDSGSTDRTVEIATARGARVLHRAFDDYARQRNFGLRDVPYRHPWLLMLDADEELMPDQKEKLRQMMSDPSAIAWRIPLIDLMFD